MKMKRRFARALAQHAVSVMPESRRFWAAGMANEMEHIEETGAALKWALGAVFASYLELATSVFGSVPVRVLLALAMLFEVFDAILAQSMIVAWRTNSEWFSTTLGSFTPGDDFHRFIPLMQIIPAWYLACGFVAGALFLGSAVQLVRRRPSAVLLFLGAVALQAASEAAVRLVPGYQEAAQLVWHFNNTNAFRDVLVPLVHIMSPIMLAVGLWLAVRGSSDSADGINPDKGNGSGGVSSGGASSWRLSE